MRIPSFLHVLFCGKHGKDALLQEASNNPDDVLPLLYFGKVHTFSSAVCDTLPLFEHAPSLDCSDDAFDLLLYADPYDSLRIQRSF